jgi:hypothetical protein
MRDERPSRRRTNNSLYEIAPSHYRPTAQECADCRLQGRDYSRDLRWAEWGLDTLYSSNFE